MFDTRAEAPPVLVIGAGIGGLATALRLQAAGFAVTILESHGWPGGKMRTVPSEAGPVDAGPTVLTMRHVFDALFRDTGSPLENHVTLIAEPIVARHFWPDGSRLDLTTDPSANADAIAAFAGERARSEFLRFSAETSALFDAFDAPMMQAADPSISALARAALATPRHLRALSPVATLVNLLTRRFSDPRLRQLFGRYATYVGGNPYQSPALLSLIWQAEARGVWRIEGGMHRLAHALAERFQALGGRLLLNSPVARITTGASGVSGLVLKDGTQMTSETVVFCGDPRALATGCLGSDVTGIAQDTRRSPRSLSARVWSFAARAETDPGLAHHNVFFAENPREEFDAIRQGRVPQDPTLYLCAEDRGSHVAPPTQTERFEIILNAAPLSEGTATAKDIELCRQTTFPTLARFGLRFETDPADKALTTPQMFETLFPGSAGSLYGQSPHGVTASLKRPRARTAIPGLYLAGGGTHPGAGVPMAALSGRFAAEAIQMDLVST